MIALNDGLRLEDSKMILPWGCKRNQAWQTGKPSHFIPNDDSRIKWDESVLNGLRCRIIAYLPDLVQLNSLSVFLQASDDGHLEGKPLEQYCIMFDHLVREIGRPTITPCPVSFSAPILTWYHEGCLLQLVTGERHGEYTELEISKGKKPTYPVIEDNE